MKRNTLVKKIIGGVLAIAAVAAISMGSATNASAQERFVAGVRVGPVAVAYHDHFRRDRFYFRDRFYHPYRCGRW